MSLRSLSLVLALMAAPVMAHAADQPSCDLDHLKGAEEIYDALVHRSVEIVVRAGAPAWKNDARLARLVAPEAPFSVGAGDVGRPFGRGVEGAHAMAATIKADRYGFQTPWFETTDGYGCIDRKVALEFINTPGGSRSKVEFFYQFGKLIEAKGWEDRYTEDHLDALQAQDRLPAVKADR